MTGYAKNQARRRLSASGFSVSPSSSSPLLLVMLVLLAAIVPVAESRHRYLGCYSGPPPADLLHVDRHVFQSVGRCEQQCAEGGPGPRWPRSTVYGLVNGSSCFCGKTVPAWAQLVGEDFCDMPCPGYARQTCELTLSSVLFWFWLIWLGWGEGAFTRAWMSSIHRHSNCTIQDGYLAVGNGRGAALVYFLSFMICFRGLADTMLEISNE